MTPLHATRVFVLVGVLALTLPGVDPARGQAGGSGSAAPSLSGAPSGDTGWPRVFEKGEERVTLYQPQVDRWDNYQKIAFRMAMAVQARAQKNPSYGVVEVGGDTFVDHDRHVVLITNLDTQVRFPNDSGEHARTLEKIARSLLPKKDFIQVSLDRMLAYMDKQAASQPGVQLNLDPPKIYHSSSPAILVVFIGPPQFRPIKGTRLMAATNTNWPVFLNQSDSGYYLLNNDAWLTAPDPVKGPWSAAGSLPSEFSSLPSDPVWEPVRKNIPGNSSAPAPRVFATTEPAELIVTQGDPVYTPISGTSLMYVSNPVMPLFMCNDDDMNYFLVAGRWFKASTLDGPWAAATTSLPADFGRIPPDSPVGDVLACVPGTREAKDAVLLASVPHTAKVKRSEAKLKVEYEGKPEFKPIDGTSMTYAVNSPSEVIEVDDTYYCCEKGVWFTAPSPTGPWAVCSSVPPDIYTIPPTSPVYNVTYVKVYDATPDAVEVGYTSGYSGEYVAATGTLMFGAGMMTGAMLASANNYYYACTPAFYSYGCAAAYHYGYGGYYRACGYYGPYGGAAHYAGYNPATGTFSRGAYHYGPYGASEVHQAYNPFTDVSRTHASATNGYQSWGRTVATHGDQWAAGGHVSGEAGRAGWAETSSGKSVWGAQGAGGGAVVKGPQDNIYAGKDGNVYKREGAGDWQHYGGNGWENAERNQGLQNRGYQQNLQNDWSSRMHGDNLSSRWGGFRGGEMGGFQGRGGFGGFRGGRGGFRR
ncbi:MAG: hypothetical protein DCC65_11600 [Planctomycetota bacterium]|nr:MAG: hypothetical protein DCC65_11600 [Planctomycetota bacterium]